jgi:hypothetical protein
MHASLGTESAKDLLPLLRRQALPPFEPIAELVLFLRSKAPPLFEPLAIKVTVLGRELPPAVHAVPEVLSLLRRERLPFVQATPETILVFRRELLVAPQALPGLGRRRELALRPPLETMLLPGGWGCRSLGGADVTGVPLLLLVQFRRVGQAPFRR